jgi:hypothetical protein
MNDAIDPVRLNRRRLLGSFAVSALGIGALSVPARAEGEEVLTEALVLRDPDIPVAGNAGGISRSSNISTISVRTAARSNRNCGRLSMRTARSG